MNTEERAHVANLLQIHRAHLRALEVQAATYGELAVPTHIVLQRAEQRKDIAALEEQMLQELPRHNLPQRDYEQFVGREQELATLRKLLLPYPKSRAYVITIDGIGGIGKSALALETAYACCDLYAHLPEDERFAAIVWVSAKRSYLTADGILERRQTFRALDDLYTAIAQVLDYPAITQAKADEQRAIVEDVLREQRTLLILDNLETVDDEDLLSFLHELPDPAKAIITTRHRIDVARPVRLSGMPHNDALALITQEADRKGVTLAADEHEQLWQRTGGVPLAIVWSIGLMGLGGSVESVLRRLGSGQSDIARFCFEESVAQIRGHDAYTLLLAISLFAADASREALGVVAGLGEDAFGRDVGLEELLRLSLVNKEGERFSVLPLTRTFLEYEVKTASMWIADAYRRWIAYYCDFVEQFSGWSEDWKGHDQVEKEMPNIFSVFEYLVRTLQYEGTDEREQVIASSSISQAKTLLILVDRLSRTCRIRGYWSDCERRASTAIKISKHIHELALTGWLSYTLARIYMYRREFQLAQQWSKETLSVGQKGNIKGMTSRANLLLGMLELQRNNMEGAEKYLQIALEDAREGGHTRGESNIMAGIGQLAFMKGDRQMAIVSYQQAIAIARQRSDLPKIASHLLELGTIIVSGNDTAYGRVLLEESLQLAYECGSASVIGRALYSLALLEITHNQQGAHVYASQALDFFRRLGMKREQAETEALLIQLAGSSDDGK